MKTKNHKGIFIITPSTELNASTVKKVSGQLEKAFDKAEGASVVSLDISQTETFDSSTLKLLLVAQSECQKIGAEFQIQTSMPAKNFLQLFHLQRRMNIINPKEDE